MLNFEDVFTHEKLIEASKRVKKKKGASGIDGMLAAEAHSFFNVKYKREIIIKRLKRGDYIAHSSRSVKIPKQNGKMRTIKIQSVIDRTVLDCLAVELQEHFKELFSVHSYGYTKGVGTHTAVLKIKIYFEMGYVYGAKLDLKSYFDKIPHKELYAKLETLVDEKLLSVIGKFVISSSSKGVPQGNPISPFLSNLYLTPFDKWLEKQTQIKFIRYADDILVLSKSPINANFIRAIEKKLKALRIKLNTEKTTIGKLVGMTFLGFIVEENGLSVPEKRVQRFKDKANKLFNTYSSSDERLNKLRDFINGWIAYYFLADIEDLISQTEKAVQTALFGNDTITDEKVSFIAHLKRLQERLSYSYM